MNDETTKTQIIPTRAQVAEALDALINTIVAHVARHPLDVFLAVARMVAVLPAVRPELSLGCTSEAAVDLVMRLPNARCEETIHPRSSVHDEPYVIRRAEASVRGLLVRAQHTRPPRDEELARLATAAVDLAPRVKPVHLCSTTFEPSRSP